MVCKQTHPEGTILLQDRFYRADILRLRVCPVSGISSLNTFFYVQLAEVIYKCKTTNYPPVCFPAPLWAHRSTTSEEPAVTSIPALLCQGPRTVKLSLTHDAADSREDERGELEPELQGC